MQAVRIKDSKGLRRRGKVGAVEDIEKLGAELLREPPVACALVTSAAQTGK
jgi:hypothetical protein